jgi:hypothetical protein
MHDGNAPAPGWYADPVEPHRERWWDGTAWTDAARAAPSSETADTQVLEPVPGPSRTAGDAGLEPTAPMAGPVAASTAVPDLSNLPAPTPPGRRRKVWLLAAASVVAIAGGAGAAILLDGDRDEPEPPALAAATGEVDDDPTVDDAGLDPDDAAPDDEPIDDGPAPIEAAPEPDDQLEDHSIEDPEPFETEDFAQPETAGSLPESWELLDVLDEYVTALDWGDLRGAHDLLSPSLQAQPGWSYEEYAEFWDGYLAGAEVAWHDDVAPEDHRVAATVDYHLTDGTTSREQLELTMVRDTSGLLLISSYRVLRAERL